MSEFNDAPISCPDEDRFDIDLFARTIAKCILNLQDPVGSVVAVHGRWGSGKSSLINLVRHHLGNAETNLTTLQFQCWLYRSEDALAVGFFRELYVGLSPALSKSKKAQKALRKIGARVAGAGALLGGVVGAFAGSIWGQIVTSSSKALEGIIKTNESDEALQNKVVEALQNSSQRFLVVIDDIDRLSPEEALVIFRLIKSVGRLPNVIYLLAYDRNTTEKAIEERYPSEGAHYLEKIVQAGFDLPVPSQSQLIKILETQIADILGDVDGASHVHLGNMFYTVVTPEIRTPRDVLRLSNALTITYQAVRGEVDPTDFLAIETFRLFRPYVYHAIRSQKSVLVGTGLDSRHVNQDKVAEQHEQLLLGKEPPNDRSRLKDGLVGLFPRLESIWSNIYSTDEIGWSKARRVCSATHFDTYFKFSLSSYTVPRSEVQELVRRADEPELVRSVFRDGLRVHLAEGRTKASFLLDELIYNASDMELRKVKPFLQALYVTANDLRVDSDENLGFTWINNRDRLHRLTRALLLNRTKLAERSQILFDAFQNASLDWLVYIGNSVFNDYWPPREGEAPALPEECLVTKEDAEKINQIALQRIREAAHDGSIINVKDLAFVLFKWRDLAGHTSGEVKFFCDTALKDDQSIVKFARAFLGQSYERHVGDHVSSVKDQARIEGIENLMDANRFRDRLTEVLRGSQLKPDDKDTVQRFLTAWEARESSGD